MPRRDAALFLIRTYIYPLSSLPRAEREILAEVIAQAPDDVARYKGFAGHQREIGRRLIAAAVSSR